MKTDLYRTRVAKTSDDADFVLKIRRTAVWRFAIGTKILTFGYRVLPPSLRPWGHCSAEHRDAGYDCINECMKADRSTR